MLIPIKQLLCYNKEFGNMESLVYIYHIARSLIQIRFHLKTLFSEENVSLMHPANGYRLKVGVVVGFAH